MNYNGIVKFDVERNNSSDSGKSHIGKSYYLFPMQIMKPFYDSDNSTLCMYLLNPTGGMLDYDTFLVHVSVKDGASALVSTPSATKIYKRREDADNTVSSRQDVNFDVATKATLEYYPEEVIPFKNSSYIQKNTFNLSADSTMIASDLFSSGRIHHGERFDFNGYKSETVINVEGTCVIKDRTYIYPEENAPQNMLTMNNFGYVSTVYCYSALCTDEIVDSIYDIEDIKDNNEILLGASMPCKNIIAVKLICKHAYDMNKYTDAVINKLRQSVLNKTELRRRHF